MILEASHEYFFCISAVKTTRNDYTGLPVTPFLERLPQQGSTKLEDVKLEILGAICALLWSVSSHRAALKRCYAGLGNINTNYCSHVTEVIKNFTVRLTSN